MDIREKVYQMFILGLEGGGYKKALTEGLGGVIFFTKDIQTPEQFRKMTSEINMPAQVQPFLSIDQEGGRVERTENIHNGKKYLSAKFAFEKGGDFLRNQTKEIAQELKSYGINLNFAPCIDVNTNPENPIIGERAFSSNTQEVIKAGRLVAQTYRENGIIPCVKHYPGHGDADADSHLTLPRIDLGLEEMENFHIAPFAAAVKDGIEMIMAAHLHCSCFDSDVIPASLSRNALSYLRGRLGFEGVIISDDMMMKGVAQFGLAAVVEKGIRAGLNMFIHRNSTPDVIDAIEITAEKARTDAGLLEQIERSYEKIMLLKQNLSGK